MVETFLPSPVELVLGGDSRPTRLSNSRKALGVREISGKPSQNSGGKLGGSRRWTWTWTADDLTLFFGSG